MTDPLGQSQVIPYLKGLSTEGYEIFLLSCEKREVFENNRSMVNGILEGFNISWYPLQYTKKPPVVSTLFDILKIRSAAKKIHKKHKLDMVHTRAGVPALIGLWLKKKYGIKFLNDIREFYADSRVEGGMWNKRKFLYRSIYNYFKKQEAAQIAASDGLVCLTYAAQKIITEWPEYKNSVPLTVIPCSADLELFDRENIDPAIKEKYRQQLNISPDDTIVSYLGSIGGWYLTEEMMIFCKRLSDRIPSVKFLFISPHKHVEIKSAATKYGIAENKIIVTKAKRTEVPILLSFSIFSIFFIEPCYSKQSSSPTKHGEIMAMGIPVITNAGVGDVQEIVEKYNAGFVVNEFSDQAYDKVIEDIEAAKVFDKTAIRNAAFEFYALSKAIDKYKALYAAVLK